MLKVYGIKNCNTMKNTFSFLEEKGVYYEFIDYKKQKPDGELLAFFADKLGIENLPNKKGTTYRKLSDQDKSLLDDPKQALELLQANTSMIKRPILVFPSGQVMAGFDPEAISKEI